MHDHFGGGGKVKNGRDQYLRKFRKLCVVAILAENSILDSIFCVCGLVAK